MAHCQWDRVIEDPWFLAVIHISFYDKEMIFSTLIKFFSPGLYFSQKIVFVFMIYVKLSKEHNTFVSADAV